VLLVVGFRRKGSTLALKPLLAVSVLGVLASALEMTLLFDPSRDPTRVYFGTDTHAQCLLVGAALAIGIALWRRRDPAPTLSRRWATVLSVLGIVGVGVCAWAWSQLYYGQVFVFRGG